MAGASTGAFPSDDPTTVALFMFLTVWWFGYGYAVAYLLYRDARARGDDRPLRWAFKKVFVPYSLYYYVWSRRRIGPRDEPPTGAEKLAALFVILPPVAGVVGAVALPAGGATMASIAITVVTAVPLAVAGIAEAAARVYGVGEGAAEADRSASWPKAWLVVLWGGGLVAVAAWKRPGATDLAIAGALALLAVVGVGYGAIRLAVRLLDSESGSET